MSKERPWEAGPFEPWVSEELNYRVDNLSKGISSYPTDGGKVSYSGPRKAWARVFSNGMNFSGNPTDSENEWGLVLKSGNGFFERYGVSNNETKQVYGYSNRDTPKYVNSQTRINIPDPGITSIETEIQKNFFAKVTINWVCHSIDQLKAIAPYFTTPLTTVIVEFGWNTFDPQSLIPINNYDTIFKIWENYYTDYSTRLSKSKGNYDYIFGQITNFEYSIEDNIIKGKTEVYSRQTFYNGFVSNGSEGIVDAEKKQKEEETKAQRENYTKYFTDVILQILSPKDELKNLLSGIMRTSIFANEHSSGGEFESKYGKNLENLNDYVFTGRDTSTISVKAKERDFDKNVDINKNTWITMELLVDILNQIKNIGEDNLLKFYYEMDIDDIIIGAHPNLISTNKAVLIPNPHAPKLNAKQGVYVEKGAQDNVGSDPLYKVSNFLGTGVAVAGTAIFGTIGEGLNAFIRAGEAFGQYVSPHVSQESTPKFGESFSSVYNYIDGKYTEPDVPNIDKNGKPIGNQVLKQTYTDHSPTSSVDRKKKIGANYTLSSYIGSKNIQREDLDYVLNRNNRPEKSQTRIDTVFNFKDGDNVEKGWLKNLYINLSQIIDIVKNPNNTTLREIYDEILKLINGSTVNFWDLQVSDVPDIKPGSAKLKIIDHKGPFNTSADKVFNFEYMTNKSIIKKLNFTTTLSNAQANQVLFRASGKEYESSNNLLDFTSGDKFQDRILNYGKSVKRSNAKDNSQKKSFFKKIAQDGDKTQDGFLQITTFSKPSTMVNPDNESGAYMPTMNQSDYNIVDLVIPYPEILTSLLNDGDLNNNINIYNSPLRNIHVELSLMGIAGIKTFEIFKILNLPPPYTSDQVVFQVENVTHTINEDTWETRIKANLRPARSLLNKPINISP